MEATNESLFQLMRFNILNSGYTDMNKSPFSAAYVYAWESGVFPAFNEGADWHKPFPEQFKVSKDEVSELGKFLDEKWVGKTPITFYELEDYYDVRGYTNAPGNWDRVKLLDTCRYMYLNSMFDSSFWSSITENVKCPSEARSIHKPFCETDIYFM